MSGVIAISNAGATSYASTIFPTPFGITGQDTFQTTGSTYTVGSNADDRYTIGLGYAGNGHGYRVLSGSVNATTGAVTGEGFTGSNTGTGLYTLTVSVGATGSRNMIAVVSIKNSTTFFHAQVGNTNTTTVDVRTYDGANVLANCEFYVIIHVSA